MCFLRPSTYYYLYKLRTKKNKHYLWCVILVGVFHIFYLLLICLFDLHRDWYDDDDDDFIINYLMLFFTFCFKMFNKRTVEMKQTAWYYLLLLLLYCKFVIRNHHLGLVWHYRMFMAQIVYCRHQNVHVFDEII